MAGEVPDWAKDESERAQPAPVGGPFAPAPARRTNPYVRLFWVIYLAILAAAATICLVGYLLAASGLHLQSLRPIG